MSADDEPDSCYRWSRDFVVAHAIFASGLVTFPVAVLLLINRPHTGRAIFFAAFAALCTTTSLILCLRFYAELRRPPWPRWLSVAAPGGLQQQQQQEEEDEDDDADQASGVVAREETTTTRATSHALRHPVERLVIHRARAEVHAALAAGRVPSYDYVGDGGRAEDCAVCLGDVEKGETVRQLPACQHVFHRDCIDPWLRAHATCPVCRSSVLPPPDRPVEIVWWTSEQFMSRPG